MPAGAIVCECLDMQGRRAGSRHCSARARAAALAGLSIRGQWPVLLLVVLLMVGLGVLVSAAGPAQFGQPRVGGVLGLGGELSHGRIGGQPRAAPGLDLTKPPEPALPGWTSIVWMLAVCMLLVLVVRWAVRLLRGAGDREDASATHAPALQDADLALTLREGVREATRALEVAAQRGAERDGVILCWLALEEAAAKAGSHRLDSQTPTEFASALLDRSGVDATAAQELLMLYHRARFGTRPLPADCAVRAHGALRRIAATLGAERPARAAVRKAHD